MEINNPSDKFFKEIQKVKENAADLINETLPADIVEKLDLSSLKLENSSYTDEKLSEYFSDLVYTCTFNKTKIKMALLFEHKSYPADYPHIQLLKYLIGIWESSIKKDKKLIFVLPIIFYHGKKKWNLKKFSDYFAGVDQSLFNFIPNFDYLLTDLSLYDDHQIINEMFKREINKAFCLVMKHYHDEDYLENNLYDIFSILSNKINFKSDEKNGIISIVYYIMYNTEIDEKYIKETLEKISPEGGQLIMTTAMKLIHQGKEEGKKEAKREDALKMLENGIDINLVVKITGLSKKEVLNLKKPS
jgi:predicted transposase/invertase (TIGR01784 family)